MTLLDNNCAGGVQQIIEDSFDRSTTTTASDSCDANRGRFDDWAPTMDESDAFEREVDNNAKEALASKLAVILFMECEARIDDWSENELMLRLALLVSSFEEGRDDVVEGSDDEGGVDSKLAVILLAFIEVDPDDDMEVFVTLDVTPSSTARRARSAAKATSALREALVLSCQLQIDLPIR